MRTFTEEESNIIRNLYPTHCTREIQRVLKCGREALIKQIRLLGLKRATLNFRGRYNTSKKRPTLHLTNDELNLTKSMAASGSSWLHIYREVKPTMGVNTFFRRLKELGLTSPRNNKSRAVLYAQLAQQGLPVKEIARRENVSTERVYFSLKKLGVNEWPAKQKYARREHSTNKEK